MFEELPLDRQLRLGIDALELNQATEVQKLAVPAALAGNDLLVSAETGSGKTLAYLIPLAQKILATQSPGQHGTLALILVPTRELARQVLKQCRQLLAMSPLKAQAITGGADFKYQKAQLRNDPEIVVATPGRLLEHCQKRSTDFGLLQTLVLDEALEGVGVPQNDGIFRPVFVHAPKGSIFNPEFPHGCEARFAQINRIPDQILQAFSQVMPERVTAGNSASVSAIAYSGTHDDDTSPYWVLIEVNEGSYGGRCGKVKRLAAGLDHGAAVGTGGDAELLEVDL